VESCTTFNPYLGQNSNIDLHMQGDRNSQRHLKHLSHNFRCFLVCLEQLFALLPFCLDVVILIQQLCKKILFIEFTDESVLNNILGVVDKEMHNSFGNLVGDSFTNNIEVGRNEAANEFCLEGFALGESGACFGLGWLPFCQSSMYECMLKKGNLRSHHQKKCCL